VLVFRFAGTVLMLVASGLGLIRVRVVMSDVTVVVAVVVSMIGIYASVGRKMQERSKFLHLGKKHGTHAQTEHKPDACEFVEETPYHNRLIG